MGRSFERFPICVEFHVGDTIKVKRMGRCSKTCTPCNRLYTINSIGVESTLKSVDGYGFNIQNVYVAKCVAVPVGQEGEW